MFKRYSIKLKMDLVFRTIWGQKDIIWNTLTMIFEEYGFNEN
uniref:Stage V sporulation protein R n=1 Tax=Schistosoma mansoni TaxID=6183 RepID=A0A5K4FCD0_SCHMA